MTPPDDEWAEGRPVEAETAEGAQPDELETLMRPRLTRRARLLRAGTLLALLALVAAGLFWRAGGATTFLASAIPSPTTTLGPPILIVSNVSYGALTINGHKIAGPPAVFRPRFGLNTLALAAEPFAPTTCSFFWPGFSLAQGDCSYATETTEDVVTGNQNVSVVEQQIEVAVRGNQLMPNACALVRQSVSAELAATHAETQVPAGQYIATGVYHDGIAVTQRTTTPLVARLVARLPEVADAPCIQFNGGDMWYPNALPPNHGHHWVAQFYAALDMVFSTPSGREVSRTHDYPASLTVDLTSDTRGNWILAASSPIAVQMAQSVCDASGQDISDAMRAKNANAEVGWGTSSAQGIRAIEGCWLDVDDAGGQVDPEASFVWRFGVLLASNSAAHKLLPDVPLAPKAEVAAVPKN